MKIAFVASEVVPFAKTGGLADVAGALPIALEQAGCEVVVIMPRYKAIQDAKFSITRVSKDIATSRIGKNIKVYFIENDEYFKRDNLYGDKTGDYPDNLERFAFFCKRAFSLLKEVNLKPDIMHLHDWQTALIAVYLKSLFSQDAFFKNTKTVITVHNIGYQGLFAKEEFPKLGLDWGLFNVEMLEYYNKINLLKGGLVFADVINTVSPTYSREIQTQEFGFGMEGILNKRKSDVFGILNGLDYSIWNPETDKYIAATYSASDLTGKAASKADLQRLCNLPVKSDVPLLGIVSRLAEQKGFDILAEDIDQICNLNVQLVILGTGDLKYHEIMESMVKKYPKVIALNLKFDDQLAHKIYAGSDIFVMPSRYEPCGLGQLISLRYGTIPLVFKTGGLADTVNKDNGFIFDTYTKEDLLKTVKKSLESYGNKTGWKSLVKKAMGYNFSWDASAKEYVRLYERAKKSRL